MWSATCTTLTMLEELLAKIHAELQHHPARRVLFVFVGNLIDRGKLSPGDRAAPCLPAAGKPPRFCLAIKRR